MSDLSDFINRADSAEKKLLALANKTQQLQDIVNSLTNNNNNNSTSNNVSFTSANKDDLLQLLTQLRAELTIEAEEKAKLQAENDKLKYRVQHLIKALNDEEAKSSKK
jgi:cell division septum initiation protein DivIVA